MDEREMLGLSNDELSEAIRVAWDMTNRTGSAHPCYKELSSHLNALLETQQFRAAAIGQQMKEQT